MPGLPVGEVIIARGLIIFGWGIFTAAVCFSRKLFGLRRLAIGWFWKDPASVGISDFFGDKISSCFGLSLCSIFRRAPRASGCVGFREMTVSLDCALRRAMLLSCARGEPSSSLPILTRRGEVDELRLCAPNQWSATNCHSRLCVGVTKSTQHNQDSSRIFANRHLKVKKWEGWYLLLRI